MAVSYGAGAFAEGLNNGVSLRNALMQRQLLTAQTKEEQEKAQQLGTLVPVNINGQTFNVPQNQAAELMNQQQERRLMGQIYMNRLGAEQQFKAGTLTGPEQNRLDAVQSAVPIHNAAMAIYQSYQDYQAGNQNGAAQALTLLKSKMAGTALAPLFEQYGNDPRNIPAIYDMVITQGALEQNKLSTGSIRPPSAEEIGNFKNTFYPPLAATPDVAYAQFKHFADAYITPAYAAAEQHFERVQQVDPATGQTYIANPMISAQKNNLEQQMRDTQETLYQLPGMGPKGTLAPEMRQGAAESSQNGATIPGVVQRAPSPNPITAAATGNVAQGGNSSAAALGPYMPWTSKPGMNLQGAAGSAPAANAAAAQNASAALPSITGKPMPRPPLDAIFGASAQAPGGTQ
jgi:hypothetical protein